MIHGLMLGRSSWSVRERSAGPVVIEELKAVGERLCVFHDGPPVPFGTPGNELVNPTVSIEEAVFDVQSLAAMAGFDVDLQSFKGVLSDGQARNDSEIIQRFA